MTVTAPRLDARSMDVSGPDRSTLRECIDTCVECARVCTTSADACLSEPILGGFRTCIRAYLDCADVCHATGQVLSRSASAGADTARAVLEACATACDACAKECEGHVDMHAHCRDGVEACRRCETACRALLASL